MGLSDCDECIVRRGESPRQMVDIYFKIEIVHVILISLRAPQKRSNVIIVFLLLLQSLHHLSRQDSQPPGCLPPLVPPPVP